VGTALDQDAVTIIRKQLRSNTVTYIREQRWFRILQPTHNHDEVTWTNKPPIAWIYNNASGFITSCYLTSIVVYIDSILSVRIIPLPVCCVAAVAWALFITGLTISIALFAALLQSASW
jgi:hypothetical protein